MATYTKETALYDTGAIADGISGAGETASNYITDVSGGGVYVHSADTPASPSSATAKGVRITDDIDIIRNGKVIANFGESIVLRRDDNGVLTECLGIYPSGVSESVSIGIRTNELKGSSEDSYSFIYAPDAGSWIYVEYYVKGSGQLGSMFFTVGVAESDTASLYTIEYDGDRTISIEYSTGNTTIYFDIWYSATIDLPYYNIGSRAGTAGRFSAIIGQNLIAEFANQTVIGKNNSNESTSVFEIGNGSDTSRSNALSVGRDGELMLALKTAEGLYDAIDEAGWTNEVMD